MSTPWCFPQPVLNHEPEASRACALCGVPLMSLVCLLDAFVLLQAAAFKLMLSDEYNFFKYTSPKVCTQVRKQQLLA